MITKTLLTLAIVVAVFIWFRAKKSKQAKYNAEAQGRLSAVEPTQNTWIKPLLYVLAALSIIVSISLYYYSWLDDNTQYQVTITNPQSGTTETFITLKKDMRGRLFITQSGREIWTSDLERIEIKKLSAGSE
jgi:ABC-type Fe3+ transport system permease subunit